MSLQQFKCLIQSPKGKHLPFLSCCYCCFWKLPQVCTNLLYNCRHPPPTLLKGGNVVAFDLLIYPLRKSTFVHNCSLWFYSGKWWQIWWRSVFLWHCTFCWKLHTWQLSPNSQGCWGKGPAQGPANQHPKHTDPSFFAQTVWVQHVLQVAESQGRLSGLEGLFCFHRLCFVLFCLISVPFAWMDYCPFLRSQGLEVPSL